MRQTKRENGLSTWFIYSCEAVFIIFFYVTKVGKKDMCEWFIEEIQKGYILI